MSKIGIDIRMLGNRHGGIGRYVLELVKNVLLEDKENHYSLFLNEKDSDLSDLEILKGFNNATLVPTGTRHYSLLEQTKFLKILNKHELDLVHFPNFNVPLFHKRAFVVTIHDLVHHKIGGAKKSHYLHFFAYKKIIQSAAQKSKAIITVSHFSKKDIISFLQVPENKIKVIYEGVFLSQNSDQKNIEKVKAKYLLNKPYFLFVGVLERKKNIIGLTRGFDEFLKKFKSDIDLVIVGAVDKHYPEIKFKAMDIKYKDHLVFTGYIGDEDLSALYKGAYAFVSSSLHEGFGLPGVEATQFGLPLLVSNIPVFNEIYDDAAIYFNPLQPTDIAAKMRLLVKDQQFHAKMQEKSLKRSLLFDWKETARETLEVYKDVLGLKA